MEKKKTFFAEASDGEIKKLVENSTQRNTKKSTKYTGTIYVRSPWETIRRVIKSWNKPLYGLLVYRRIMPSAEWLSSKFLSCTRSFASLLGQLFIFQTIFQPWELSSDIPAAETGSFTKYIRYLYGMKKYYPILRHFDNHTVYACTIAADQTWVSMNAACICSETKKKK